MKINEFLDNYYKWLKNKNLNKSVNIPEKMIIGNTLNSDGWAEWQLADSEIEKFDIFRIEEIYKIKLPNVYKEYLMSKQFLDIQIDKYTLFGINTKVSLEKVLDLFPKNIILDGYIPLGQIDDYDYIALNLNNNEVVRLDYDTYVEIEKLSDELEFFLSLLNQKIK